MSNPPNSSTCTMSTTSQGASFSPMPHLPKGNPFGDLVIILQITKCAFFSLMRLICKLFLANQEKAIEKERERERERERDCTLLSPMC